MSAPVYGSPSPRTTACAMYLLVSMAISSGAGAMFLPLARTRMFFSRSVIRMRPISSSSPMSPVWNQPSASITAAVSLGLVEVADHHLRAAGEDLARSGINPHDRLRDRPAHGAELEIAGPVDGEQGRRLRQAVALEDEHAHGVEELPHLARQWGAAGDEVPDATAGARPDLVEDEPLRDRELDRQPRGVRVRRRGGSGSALGPAHVPSRRSAGAGATTPRPSTARARRGARRGVAPRP